MKKFKKTLGLMLAFAMLLALLPVTTASAAITSRYEAFAGFNNPTVQIFNATDPWGPIGFHKVFNVSLFTESSVAYSQPGLYGKGASDYALSHTGGTVILRTGLFEAANGGNEVSMKASYQVATPVGGGYSFTQNNVPMKLTDGSAWHEVIRVDSNAVQFMGMDTTFSWTDEVWHKIDLVIDQGPNPTLTVLIDGQPLTAANGTFDGFHSNTYYIPLIGGSDFNVINGSQLLKHVPVNSGYYFDNWELTGWLNASDSVSLKGQEYSITTYNFTTAADAMSGTIRNLAAQGQAASDEAGEYVSLVKKEPYSRFLSGGTDRDDVTYRLYFDFKIPEGNTIANYFSFEAWRAGCFNVLLDDGAGGLYYGFNTIAGAQVPERNGQWHTIGAEFNGTAGADGTPRTVFSLNSAKLNLPAATVTSREPEFRIYGLDEANAWGVKNFKRMLVKNKPLIKEVAYGSATDDYAVDPTVDTITVTLTDPIAAADNTTVLVRDAEGEVVPAEVTLGEDKKTLTLALGADMNTRTAYQIVLTENLVCEDSAIGGGWYQELENELVYDFMTGYKAFDWTKVEFVVAERQTATNEETGEAVDSWLDPVAWTYYYIVDRCKVGANITMNNTTGADKTITGIVAIYNPDDSLRYITQQQLTFANGGISTQQLLSDPVANTALMKVKVYLWESIDSMTPVTRGFFLWEKRDEGNGPKYPGMYLHQQ